jgi:hypothetical protein
MYANPYAIQNMPSAIRNAIASEYVNDYDIVNCHPVLLSQLCKKNNIISPTLDDYIVNRDAWLAGIDDNRTSAKNEVIRILYGGEARADGNQQLVSLSNEIALIINNLSGAKENAKYLKKAMDKRYNQEGTFLSFVLQDIENNILVKCIHYCKDNGIKISSLIFDGFTVDKTVQIDLADLSRFVMSEIGYKVEFVNKPMESYIEVPESALDMSGIIMYETLKERFEIHCWKIMQPIVFVDNGEYLTRDSLKIKYENLKYHTLKGNSLKLTSFVNDWLQDPEMKTYNGMGNYPPPLVCPQLHYNTYKRVEWDDLCPEDVELKPFLDHLDVMCNFDKTVADYIICWLAHIIQQPAVKTEVLISFVGAEGTGKSLFMKCLSRLFGEEKYLETNSPEQHIFGRFASWFDKTLVVLNDYNPGDTRGCDREKFKMFLTETRSILEQKGIKAIETRNYTNFITTTNSYNPVHKTAESRRFMIVETSSCKKGDFEYFHKLDNDFIMDNACICMLYHYLKNVDLSNFNIRTPPETSVGNLVSQANSSPVESFMSSTCLLQDLVEFRKESVNGFIVCKKIDEGAVKCISQRKLHEEFVKWCGAIENNIDYKQWNSKKLQVEVYKLRDKYGLQYRPNKNNSSLSMWLISSTSRFFVDFLNDEDDE